MKICKNLTNTAFGYLAIGIAFLAVASSGQAAFTGVGFAFIGLALVFMAKSRKV